MGNPISISCRVITQLRMVLTLLGIPLALVARDAVHARVAAVYEVAIARSLIALRRSLITVGGRLIGIGGRLIGIGGGLIGVGRRLVRIRAGLVAAERLTVFRGRRTRRPVLARYLRRLTRGLHGTIA
ncbi:MAG TPA: hypothetical protein VIJ33_04385 [Solirubrobacteraceae bacterium]